MSTITESNCIDETFDTKKFFSIMSLALKPGPLFDQTPIPLLKPTKLNRADLSSITS